MANKYICSDCGKDGTRCFCHEKRKPVFRVFDSNEKAKLYNAVHGTKFSNDAALARYKENKLMIHNARRESELQGEVYGL